MLTARTVLVLSVLAGCTSSPDGRRVDLDEGGPGIGFDDLRYSATLHRVLAPGGRAGKLFLVDPDTLAVETVEGFGVSNGFDGGHDVGPTSVDEGAGFLFVTDRTTGRIHTIDPRTRTIVKTAPLSASPDYVRFVTKTNEVWVSEPSASQLEVFTIDAGGALTSSTTIPVDNGPESLVVAQESGRVFTHHWQSSSIVFDAATRKPIAEWPNGCAASRGLDVDEARGFFFASCSEGTTSVLDLHDGHMLSTIAKGAGFDVVGYDRARAELSLAGTACACLVVLGVSDRGELSFRSRSEATASAHCAVADDRGHAWFCDPAGGAIFRVDEP